MKMITAYLNFDGNCHEAMTFYAKCLDAELNVMRFGESPMQCPDTAKDRVMNAGLMKNQLLLMMASDTMPGMPFVQGNNFSLCLDCESSEEADKLFAALSAGGKVTMPLAETFWAHRFGMLTDKFGIAWMCNFPKPMESIRANMKTASAAG